MEGKKKRKIVDKDRTMLLRSPKKAHRFASHQSEKLSRDPRLNATGYAFLNSVVFVDVACRKVMALEFAF